MQKWRKTPSLERIMKLDKKGKEQFAAYMRSLRLNAGLTQREVQKRSGVSCPYLALLESGSRNSPSYEYLERLAAVYNVSVEQMAQKAGYKQRGQSPAIPPERIEWAFTCARSDPDFTYGIQIQPHIESMEAKAFFVELYQRATGQKLLTSDQQSAAFKLINTHQEPTPDDAIMDDAQDLENLAKSASAESAVENESTVPQKAKPKRTRKIRPMR